MAEQCHLGPTAPSSPSPCDHTWGCPPTGAPCLPPSARSTATCRRWRPREGAGRVDGGRDAGLGWEELSPSFKVSFSWSNNQLDIRQIQRSKIISNVRNPAYFRSSMTVGKMKHTCPSEPGDWKEVWGFKGRYLRQLEEEQVLVSEMCDVPYRWVTQIKFIFGSDSHSEKHHPQTPLTPAPSCHFSPSR